jgi:squalene-hopene/tetraprenyl-beta-curcumene cyclase
VPDADDTSGALVALRKSGEPDRAMIAAAAAGVRWLLGLQNRDGGIPTFCRGWGTLPFDRSTPEITAHALQAWSGWYPHFDGALQESLRRASDRAIAYLAASQQADGSWVPLWFGNEHAPDENSPVYGTSRALLGVQTTLVRDDARAVRCRRMGIEWLLAAQHTEGGWGGDRGIAATIEETGVALAALGRSYRDGDESRIRVATLSGARWLIAATSDQHMSAAPVGLYFARLWYFEALYPLVFGLEGLAGVKVASARTGARDTARV